MAYKTKAEKRAFRAGLLRGLFRKKKGASKKSSGGARKKSKPKCSSNGSRSKTRSPGKNPFGMTYAQMLKEKELEKLDLLGDFDYDRRGRIKGSYIDGRFEPD